MRLTKATDSSGRHVEMEELSPVRFSALRFRSDGRRPVEADLEELIVRNVGLLALGDEDLDLLIIGRQKRTSTSKQMDLVALDREGTITLIEVKRDAEDVRYRVDHAEIQAVRYAASLARLSTVDEIVTHLFGPYVERYERAEFEEAGLTAVEHARRKLGAFLGPIEGGRQLNARQKIVLVGAGFDEDTLSAAAWLAENNVPIRVVVIQPIEADDEILFDVQQLVPGRTNASFYVDLAPSRSDRSRSSTRVGTRTRTARPKIEVLHARGKVNAGDPLWLNGKKEKVGTFVPPNRVAYAGDTMSLNAFAMAVSEWDAINAYAHVVHGPTNLLLDELRNSLEPREGEASDDSAM